RIFAVCFFFQAEDGIRDPLVTGVQTCALPISWLAEPYRSNLSDLERVLLTTPSGSPVLLKNVASLKLNSGPVKIDRKYFQRVVHITANPEDRNLGPTAEELAGKFASLRLPKGLSTRLPGRPSSSRRP